MSAVILLVGSTMADALGGISRSYRKAFESLGHSFVEINLLDKDKSVEQLNKLGRMEVAFAFSFMGMGTDIMVDVSNGQKGDLWDVLHIPYISLYGDSPAYFFDRHVLRNPGYVGLYGFPEHYEFRKRLPNINGIVDTYPPSAIDVIDRSEVDFKKKAEGQIVMLKNGGDPQKLIDIWSTKLEPRVGKILLEIASELRAHADDKSTTQIDDILLSYFRGRDVDITALVKFRLFAVSMLDDYLRRYKSKLLIESLLDTPVLLNGYNWDHIDFAGKRMQYIPGGQYTASTSLIRNALATIDLSPNTGGAPHDRPLRSIGSHTLCITNEQEFFRRELPHADYFSYSFNKDSIQSRIADVLANPQRSVEAGADVTKTFLEKFPPERFAQKLLALAPAARFNQLPGVPDGTPNYYAWPPTKL